MSIKILKSFLLVHVDEKFNNGKMQTMNEINILKTY